MADESKDLDKLVNKAIKDKGFRHKLENQPKEALKELHISDKEGEEEELEKRVAAVRQLSWRQLQNLAKSFGYEMNQDAN
jgi:hypothetical protein